MIYKLIFEYPCIVVKQYGKAHTFIIKCKIIGNHKLLVFLYIAPKYIPIAIVHTTFVSITSKGCPKTPNICPNPKITDDTKTAIIVLFSFYSIFSQ